MAGHSGSPYDHQFSKLMDMHGSGESEPIFADLLRHGPSIFVPLSEFLIAQPNEPRIAILIDLLGKCLDDRAIPILMRFLDIPVPELRRAAANGLGWNRARVGLEKLDELEANDPDERVRLEARAAIEEILRDFPKLRSVLHHHRPPEGTEPGSATHSDVSVAREAEDGRMRTALPRLLALKYNAVPLRLDETNQLHLAVLSGSERRLISTLSHVTGLDVILVGWMAERIQKRTAELYTGDDDFCCGDSGDLTAAARDELAELILRDVDPKSPCCPLSEATDAVEAVQTFLSALGFMGLDRGTIRAAGINFEILLSDDHQTSSQLDPPPEALQPRFIECLRMLAGITAPHRSPTSRQEGRIRCVQGGDGYLLHLVSERKGDDEIISFHLEHLDTVD